ncbi:ATP-dependent DNA ligase [Pseudomonas putida]|nr:ATP-dependent DNA ligase [Pseudomonas putida]
MQAAPGIRDRRLYTDPKGSRHGFGALLLALHDHDSASCATPARSAPASALPPWTASSPA